MVDGFDDRRDPRDRLFCSTGAEIAAAVIAAVSAVATGVSTAVSQSNAAKQADAAAKQSERDAEQARVNAEAQAQDQARESEHVRDRQKVMMAASGVQPIGSPLEVMLDSAKEAELEVQRIKSGAQQYGNMKRYEAAQYKSQASGYRTSAAISGATGVLGGLYAGYGAYNKAKPKAVP